MIVLQHTMSLLSSKVGTCPYFVSLIHLADLSICGNEHLYNQILL